MQALLILPFPPKHSLEEKTNCQTLARHSLLYSILYYSVHLNLSNNIKALYPMKLVLKIRIFHYPYF